MNNKQVVVRHGVEAQALPGAQCLRAPGPFLFLSPRVRPPKRSIQEGERAEGLPGEQKLVRHRPRFSLASCPLPI